MRDEEPGGSVMKSARKMFVLLVFVLVFIGMTPACTVYAKTQAVEMNRANYKKAHSFKSGNTRVRLKRRKNRTLYLKFKAPKDGHYSITLSDFNVKSKNRLQKGEFRFYTKSGKRLKQVDFRIGNLTGNRLVVCTEELFEREMLKGDGSIYSVLPARTGVIRLKKGQVLYLGGNFSKNCTFKISCRHFINRW